MLIGLTGIYCAGKNHIGSLLEKRGLPVLDVDKLGYQALEMEKETIFTRFGADLKKAGNDWQSNALFDRQLLGRVVFGNPEKLAILEAIIHPVVNKMTNEWISAQNGHCVINAALLHRSSVFTQIDRIILVKAPFITRFIRAKRRDKLSCKDILKRFRSQKDFYTQYLSIKAEIYKVENSGLFGTRNSKLNRQIDKILEGIK